MIRRAGPDDAAALAVLHARAFPRGWREAEMRGLVEQSSVLALCHAPPGLGFAMARLAADEAEILTIAVSEDQRRGGLGRALLAALETAARDRGAARMFLDVSDRNRAARALYDSAGYRRTGRRAAYYADGSDALIFSKKLS